MLTFEQLLKLKPGDEVWFSHYWVANPKAITPAHNKKPQKRVVVYVFRNGDSAEVVFANSPGFRAYIGEGGASTPIHPYYQNGTLSLTEAEAWAEYSKALEASVDKLRKHMHSYEIRIQKTLGEVLKAETKAASLKTRKP